MTELIVEVKEVDEETAFEIFREIMNGRFVTDIFERNDSSKIDSTWIQRVDDGWVGECDVVIFATTLVVYETVINSLFRSSYLQKVLASMKLCQARHNLVEQASFAIRTIRNKDNNKNKSITHTLSPTITK